VFQKAFISSPCLQPAIQPIQALQLLRTEKRPPPFLDGAYPDRPQSGVHARLLNFVTFHQLLDREAVNDFIHSIVATMNLLHFYNN
jgi:hypothetical protein